MTDKQWLLQNLPNATYDQEYIFIKHVGDLLENPEKTEREARDEALKFLRGHDELRQL